MARTKTNNAQPELRCSLNTATCLSPWERVLESIFLQAEHIPWHSHNPSFQSRPLKQIAPLHQSTLPHDIYLFGPHKSLADNQTTHVSITHHSEHLQQFLVTSEVQRLIPNTTDKIVLLQPSMGLSPQLPDRQLSFTLSFESGNWPSCPR